MRGIKAVVGTMCIEVKDYDNKSAHKFAHTILGGKLLNRPESHIEGRMKISNSTAAETFRVKWICLN